MGILWAHTGAIGYVVLINGYSIGTISMGSMDVCNGYNMESIHVCNGYSMGPFMCVKDITYGSMNVCNGYSMGPWMYDVTMYRCSKDF